MSERGLSPAFYKGLNYNQQGDVASERKRTWDGLVLRTLEMKKPYNFKTYQDMIYTYDRRDGKSPYTNSRKETVIPVGSFQSQRASFDGLDPSPFVSQKFGSQETIHFHPTASCDDGQWSPYAFYNTGYSNVAGYDSQTGLINLFCRFPAVDIPKGAIIDSAIFTLTSNSNRSSGTVNVKIYANGTDDAVAPTNVATAQALVNTSAYGQWNNLGSWAAGSTYNSTDLKSVIQEVIDRGGVVGKNALMLIVRNNGSNNFRDARAYGYYVAYGSGLETLTVVFRRPV